MNEKTYISKQNSFRFNFSMEIIMSFFFSRVSVIVMLFAEMAIYVDCPNEAKQNIIK